MQAYINKITDKKNISWKGAKKIDVSDVSITVKDLNEAEASFKSPTYLDVSNGTFIILITHPQMPNYSGIILSVDYDAEKEMYSYKSKDFHILYNKKITTTYKKATGKTIVQDMLCWGEIQGKTSTVTAKKDKKTKKTKKLTKAQKKANKKAKKTLKSYSRQLAGLLPESKYKMEKYGGSGNPMTKMYKNQDYSNKTFWEIIKSYTVGQTPYLDLSINDYGTLSITPFHKDEWMKPVAKITDVSTDMDLKFNAEGIIGASGQSDIFSVKLEDVQDTRKPATTSSSSKSKKSGATSSSWVCKEKKIALNMDLRTTYSNDRVWLNKVASELRKLGWKVDVVGVGPGINVRSSEFHRAGKGIYLTIDNGQDTEVLREGAQADYCKGKLQRQGAIWSIFFVGISRAKSFLKGGIYYNSLVTAHDAKGAGGVLKYPAGYLAWSGVPFGFCFNDSPSAVAKKIDAGGDSELAHKNNFFKCKCHGYYHNSGWGKDY